MERDKFPLSLMKSSMEGFRSYSVIWGVRLIFVKCGSGLGILYLIDSNLVPSVNCVRLIE